MRVIIAGGGTGGHFFPGLAVAEEFRNRDVQTEVIFVRKQYVKNSLTDSMLILEN